jgi:hypothetical protein
MWSNNRRGMTFGVHLEGLSVGSAPPPFPLLLSGVPYKESVLFLAQFPAFAKATMLTMPATLKANSL